MSPSQLLLIALPPVSASVIVLTIAGVSVSVWTMHVVAIALSVSIAIAVSRLRREAHAPMSPALVIALAIAGVVVTLFARASGPSRWAIAFVVGLVRASASGPRWLAGVAAYYAVLFLCSVKGLTPAPLVGFGAGPVLGFGLLSWPEHGAAPVLASTHSGD